ncbi:MAG TPA: SCO1664 family protein [Acidimicrobiales bacterium]|nr:SCO1664 family protein [Acidimicrobiales bacterium]
MPQDERPPATGIVTLLAEGEIEIVGRMPWSSNQTFLVTCTSGEQQTGAVYKPERGERHLWDFPGAIFRREVAAYELSAALGWELVPETITRSDAPFGEGSLQRFVDADFSQHHFTLIEDERHHERLRVICAFDVVANNADRKSGHCILGEDGKIWAIDNGLCFHREPKLRTVIWEFAGDPVPDPLLEDLSALADNMPASLEALLSPTEMDAVGRRARRLVKSGRFPVPDPNEHCYPWPLI